MTNEQQKREEGAPVHSWACSPLRRRHLPICGLSVADVAPRPRGATPALSPTGSLTYVRSYWLSPTTQAGLVRPAARGCVAIGSRTSVVVERRPPAWRLRLGRQRPAPAGHARRRSGARVGGPGPRRSGTARVPLTQDRRKTLLTAADVHSTSVQAGGRSNSKKRGMWSLCASHGLRWPISNAVTRSTSPLLTKQ